jgi:hypothetical protein
MSRPRYKVIAPDGRYRCFRHGWAARLYARFPNAVRHVTGSRYRWLIFYGSGGVS